MSLDAASKKRQLAELGWTKRNVGGGCRHWEQPLSVLLLLREPWLQALPIQTPIGGVTAGGVTMALGNCIATTESDPDSCAREALARRGPRAGWGCTVCLWDARPWEHHFSREDLSMVRSEEK